MAGWPGLDARGRYTPRRLLSCFALPFNQVIVWFQSAKLTQFYVNSYPLSSKRSSVWSAGFSLAFHALEDYLFRARTQEVEIGWFKLSRRRYLCFISRFTRFCWRSAPISIYHHTAENFQPRSPSVAGRSVIFIVQQLSNFRQAGSQALCTIFLVCLFYFLHSNCTPALEFLPPGIDSLLLDSF